MKLYFLPDWINECIDLIDFSSLEEIRVRVGHEIVVRVLGNYYLLSSLVMSNSNKTCDKDDIEFIIDILTEKSIYSFNEEIKCGFITSKDGYRVGIAGKCIFEDGKVVTINNIESLNVRIPHRIEGCADKIFSYVYKDGDVKNSIIVSPPGCGKTTILKEIIKKISNLNYQVLVVDERGEFSNINYQNIDKISFSDKSYAINYGIRSLAPQIVVLDEISSKSDWVAIEKVVSSGVKIIATHHGDSLSFIRDQGVNDFDLIFILEDKPNIGSIKGVYNKRFELI